MRLKQGTHVFNLSPKGPLNPDAFVSGAAAADADDRIVYDPATGNLFYDRDGTGDEVPILFAILDPGLAVTASDFVVF